MGSGEQVTFTRDCEAILIPFGQRVTLKKGDEATITQALGGSYTLFVRGSLVRIGGKDADAIGKEPVPQEQTASSVSESGVHGDNVRVDEQTVWNAMRSCYDPEIPINIVDLGLIYSCELLHLEGDGTKVEVKMTLTAPGCGIGGLIADEVKQRILGIPGVNEVDVELVWDPPWNQSMMSEAARLKLGML